MPETYTEFELFFHGLSQEDLVGIVIPIAQRIHRGRSLVNSILSTVGKPLVIVTILYYTPTSWNDKKQSKSKNTHCCLMIDERSKNAQFFLY
jgi:hypothetical protein